MSDLFVDKYNLDDAAATQPELYMECVEAIERAKKDTDELEQELEERYSELDLDIRKNYDLYGLEENPKERAIKSAISKEPDIKEIREDLAKAKRILSKLNGRKEALDQRKQMVRLLGDLWLGEYYSDIEVRDAQVRKNLSRRNRNV